MEDKKKSVDQLNEIQATIQEVFYQLESYVDHDPGSAALVKCIELSDEISNIRNRVLRGNNDVPPQQNKHENKN
jgi:hypothetical protein